MIRDDRLMLSEVVARFVRGVLTGAVLADRAGPV